jgi:GntR family transcriptional regulator, galactonate operon transcriptional repressor
MIFGMERGHVPANGQASLNLGKHRASRRRLASVVVEELARRIISGSLPAGSPLPTEDALCREFGFSRTVMREGLKLLEERGLVRVEQGRGTTVQSRERWNMLERDVLRIALEFDENMVLLNDLIAVRRVLEGQMASAAAERLTDEELAALAANVEEMAASTDDYARFRALDLGFHRLLMRASASEIGSTIVAAIHDFASESEMLNSPGAAELLEHTVAEHRAILEALAARDGELAARRVLAHIESAWAERRQSFR